METVIFKNSKGLKLVGDFYAANSNKAVVISHGFTGNRHEWGKYDELANLINKEGYNVLTFDFSGSGESDDELVTVSTEINDLNCAINLVKSRGITDIALIGLSLGGLVSLNVCDERIKAMVLYAPVTSSREDYEVRKWSNEQQTKLKTELEKNGYISLKLDKGIRKIMKIDKQMIVERKSVNQAELLSKVKIPVLILHGKTDTSVRYEDSVDAMKYLPKGSQLQTISGDNHFDDKNYSKFFSPTIDWLKKHFS